MTKRMNQYQREKARNCLEMKRCAYCGSKQELTIDHKIPIIKGGSNELKNLQCLCKRCNTTKSDLSHSDVLRVMRLHDTILKEKQLRKVLNKIKAKKHVFKKSIRTKRKKVVHRYMVMLAMWRKRTKKWWARNSPHHGKNLK